VSTGPLAPGTVAGGARRLTTVARNRFFSQLSEEGLYVKTFMAKASNVERQWYVIDASGMVVGRLASQVASMLRGKHKPTYTPHVDTGDYIIVVNTDKMVFTGKKLDSKIYYRHSGYVGGLKETTARRMMEKKSETVLKEAVRGMLPKGPLGYAMLTKLHLYAGAEHEHQAQKPVAFEVK
jgi:large subunit ribosomal protein L13